MDEKSFCWMMNEDAMATEKLAQGIHNFAIDIEKLKDMVKAKISEIKPPQRNESFFAKFFG